MVTSAESDVFGQDANKCHRPPENPTFPLLFPKPYSAMDALLVLGSPRGACCTSFARPFSQEEFCVASLAYKRQCKCYPSAAPLHPWNSTALYRAKMSLHIRYKYTGISAYL